MKVVLGPSVPSPEPRNVHKLAAYWHSGSNPDLLKDGFERERGRRIATAAAALKRARRDNSDMRNSCVNP
jgi:hypothetical protein